eukprot:5051267-Pyramimonas_sp.AAC.1
MSEQARRVMLLLSASKGGDSEDGHYGPVARGSTHIPGAGTNRSRDGRIYPGQEPIGAGTGGYTRGRNQSERGRPTEGQAGRQEGVNHERLGRRTKRSKEERPNEGAAAAVDIVRAAKRT